MLGFSNDQSYMNLNDYWRFANKRIRSSGAYSLLDLSQIGKTKGYGHDLA
jgi:hypothetical protein